jgi:hypothetical protein
MQDRFEPREGHRIGEDGRTQFRAIDGAVVRDPGKRRGDRRHAGAAAGEQRMDRRVGVVDGYAQAAEQLGRRRFAHGDRAREPDDFHSATTPLARKNPSKGSNGRPSTVK